MRAYSSWIAPRRGPTSLAAVLALAMLAGAVGLVSAALLLTQVLIPLASACIQACARDPLLLSIARGTAALAVACVASGVVVGGVVLGRLATATRRLVRRVESASVAAPRRLATLASELGFAGCLTYVPDAAPYAFCYGFRSPRICISSGLADGLSTNELRAVLLHEGYHLGQRDPLKVLASRIAAGFLYMLPVAADLRDRYLVEKELRADSHVVDESSTEALAGALLKLCRNEARHPVSELAAAAVGPFSIMAARIRNLGGGTQVAPLRAGRVAASLAAVGLVLALTVGSGYAAERSAPAAKSCCASATYCAGTEGANLPQ